MYAILQCPDACKPLKSSEFQEVHEEIIEKYNANPNRVYYFFFKRFMEEGINLWDCDAFARTYIPETWLIEVPIPPELEEDEVPF
jgi:hypothetical protein